MPLEYDRLKGAIYAVVRNAFPRIDHMALYRARVVVVSEDGKTLDCAPDDDRLPTFSRLKLLHGIPGVEISMPEVAVGTYVLVGWSGGDPSQPYCCLWEGGETTMRLTLKADTIQINGDIVELGGTNLTQLDGCLTGLAVDPFTGATHFSLGNASNVVKAKKQ